MTRTVSNLSDIASKVTGSMRAARANKAATVRAPKQSKSTLRGGLMGTWAATAAPAAAPTGGAAAAKLAAAKAAAPAVVPRTQVFGVPLAELMERQEKQLAGDLRFKDLHVPHMANKLIEHVTIRGIKEEGILRLAASHDETDRLKQTINAGGQPDLYATSIHVIGDLLKGFLRDLPGSLLDSSKWDRWMAIAELDNVKERVVQCKALLLELDHNNRALITVLFKMFAEIARWKRYNKMDAVNLSKVFAPNVLQQASDKFDAVGQLSSIPRVACLVETLIVHYGVIFKELMVQHPPVTTVNIKKAAAARSSKATSSVRTTLRAAPPVPPPPKAAAAAKPALVKMQSEVAPMRKDATTTVLTRANTESLLSNSENRGNDDNRRSRSDGPSKLTPTKGLRELARARAAAAVADL